MSGKSKAWPFVTSLRSTENASSVWVPVHISVTRDDPRQLTSMHHMNSKV